MVLRCDSYRPRLYRSRYFFILIAKMSAVVSGTVRYAHEPKHHLIGTSPQPTTPQHNTTQHNDDDPSSRKGKELFRELLAVY